MILGWVKFKQPDANQLMFVPAMASTQTFKEGIYHKETKGFELLLKVPEAWDSLYPRGIDSVFTQHKQGFVDFETFKFFMRLAGQSIDQFTPTQFLVHDKQLTQQLIDERTSQMQNEEQTQNNFPVHQRIRQIGTDQTRKNMYQHLTWLPFGSHYKSMYVKEVLNHSPLYLPQSTIDAFFNLPCLDSQEAIDALDFDVFANSQTMASLPNDPNQNSQDTMPSAIINSVDSLQETLPFDQPLTTDPHEIQEPIASIPSVSDNLSESGSKNADTTELNQDPFAALLDQVLEQVNQNPPPTAPQEMAVNEPQILSESTANITPNTETKNDVLISQQHQTPVFTNPLFENIDQTKEIFGTDRATIEMYKNQTKHIGEPTSTKPDSVQNEPTEPTTTKGTPQDPTAISPLALEFHWASLPVSGANGVLNMQKSLIYLPSIPAHSKQTLFEISKPYYRGKAQVKEQTHSVYDIRLLGALFDKKIPFTLDTIDSQNLEKFDLNQLKMDLLSHWSKQPEPLAPVIPSLIERSRLGYVIEQIQLHMQPNISHAHLGSQQKSIECPLPKGVQLIHGIRKDEQFVYMHHEDLFDMPTKNQDAHRQNTWYQAPLSGALASWVLRLEQKTLQTPQLPSLGPQAYLMPDVKLMEPNKKPQGPK